MTLSLKIEELLNADLTKLDPNLKIETPPNIILQTETTPLNPPSEKVQEVVTWLHQQIALSENYSPIKELQDRFDLGDQATNPDFWKAVNKQLEHRELPLYEVSFKKEKILDPIFVMACSVISDVNNKKTLSKKLESVGLSTAKFNNYLKIRRYSDYYTKIVNRLIDYDAFETSRVMLANNVAQGDLASIKYLHEFTHKFTPQRDMDIRIITHLLKTIVEIVANNTDGVTARKIADAIETSAIETLGNMELPK